MSLHALLPLASQSVPHPLLTKFTACFLIWALQKRSSTDVLFHEPISQSHLLMIYKSSPLRVQPHPWRWWLFKKSGSRNSTATLLLMNILRLLLIPRIFDMISYLVIFIIECDAAFVKEVAPNMISYQRFVESTISAGCSSTTMLRLNSGNRIF